MNNYHISPTYEDSWTVYKNARPLATFDFKEDAEQYLDMLMHPENYTNPQLDNLGGFDG